MTHSTPKWQKSEPHNSRHFTVKKKMINRFPTPLTLATPINYYDIPLPQVVQSKDFSKCCPHKEYLLQRSLKSPNTQISKYFSKEVGNQQEWTTHGKTTWFQTSTLNRESNIFILHCHNMTKYKSSKKEETKSTSQSCTGLVKDMFYWIFSLRNCTWSANHMSLQCTILNKFEKDVFNGCLPHDKPCQNLILDQSPTPYLTKLEKTPQPLVYFYTPAPKVSSTSLKYQPLLMPSNLVSTTDIHKASLFVA